MADIVRYAGQGFIERSRRWINGQHEKVLTAITRCRTAALGGHRDQCAGCGHTAISYNSCRNRHCPKCQGNARIRGPSEVPALQRNHARRRTLSIGSTASPLSTAHRQVRRMILPTPASNGLGATASLPHCVSSHPRRHCLRLTAQAGHVPKLIGPHQLPVQQLSAYQTPWPADIGTQLKPIQRP
jgi:hypothetical protein